MSSAAVHHMVSKIKIETTTIVKQSTWACRNWQCVLSNGAKNLKQSAECGFPLLFGAESGDILGCGNWWHRSQMQVF